MLAFKFLLSFLVLYIFTGCSSKHPMDPQMTFKPPRYVEEMPPQIEEDIFSSPGSIFGQGDNPLFSDRKAMHVNDIVTIVISETTSQSTSASRDLSKITESTLGGGLFTGNGTNAALESKIAKLNGLANLGFTTKSDASFSGSGSNSRDESFTTNITGRVVKIMNNGNYFIEGRREIMIEDNKQIIQISGVISPYNISKNNEIDSKYIGDAKISYLTEGDIKRNTTQGWGSKLVEGLWPF